MKKFMKFCGIAAAILIALGLMIALPCTAIQGAASISRLVEDKTNGAVKVKRGITVQLNGLSDWGILIGEDSIDQTFDATKIQSLSITTLGSVIEIKTSPDSDFHLEGTAFPKFQGSVKDGMLCIDGGKEGVTQVGAPSGELSLYVPKGFAFDKIDLNVGAGEIACEEQIKADSVKLTVGMGEVSFGALDVRELEATVNMGNVELAGQIREKAQVSCDMGCIQLTLPGSMNDYNYDIGSAMGEITIGEYSVSGLTSSKEWRNDAPCDISLDCAMGSIDVCFEE